MIVFRIILVINIVFNDLIMGGFIGLNYIVIIIYIE